MRIVVNTPNGNIGRPLTLRLLDAGQEVVILGRSPEKVADLVARGARLVEGSIDDRGALDRALAGAGALFWLAPPSHRPDAHEWAVSTARAAAEAAQKHGVRRALVISSTGAHSGPGTGPVSPLLAVEDTFRAAVPDVVVLRPGFFMENLLRDLATIQSDGAIYSPVPTDKHVPMVATHDIMAKAAAFLLDPAWTGQHIVGVHGPADLSYSEVAAVLTAALGRPVRHVEIGLDQLHAALLQRGMPPFLADTYREMYAAIQAGRMDPAERRTHETTTATSLFDFARSTLLPALRKAEGAPDPAAFELVSRADQLMEAWEMGATETYKALCAPGARMTIPAYGLDVQGFDAIWAVRTSMKPLDAGPLHLHTMSTHTLTGRTVSALAHVVDRKTGQFTQHSKVKLTFDAQGRLEHYHQDVLWREG